VAKYSIQAQERASLVQKKSDLIKSFKITYSILIQPFLVLIPQNGVENYLEPRDVMYSDSQFVEDALAQNNRYRVSFNLTKKILKSVQVKLNFIL
jgi:hypothetical protein